MMETFIVQDLINLLNGLTDEEKKMPIMIEDYGGHLRSSITIYRDLDKDNREVLVLCERRD